MKIIIDMPTPELQKAAENKVDDWTKQWGTLSIDQIWQRERDLMSSAFAKQQEKLDNDKENKSCYTTITYKCVQKVCEPMN